MTKIGRAPLSIDTINTNVINSEYAVRGEIVQIAQRISKELEEGRGNYPFDKIVWCNIGNPQILGQKPITYFRQVLALCECPQVRQVSGVSVQRSTNKRFVIENNAADPSIHASIISFLSLRYV